METIIIALIFSVPGIIVNRVLFRIFPKSIETKSEYEKTITAIIDSIFVLVINMVILNLFLKKNILTFNILLDKLSYIIFFMKYVILTLCSCIIVSLIKKFIFNPIVLLVINKYKESKDGIKENEWPSAWESIFENSKISKNDMYITLEKNGQIITSGMLATYAPPNQERRDILLKDTQGFKLYLDNDKNLPKEKKLLDIIECEYYDFNNDLLIKVYDNKKLVKYLNEP
ncbi:hypothetical protein H8S20_00025 [Clostridium sp. NSJ-6]|uniref:Uncharacterized protein n=1 Tax=Clostridium hominis TaxID=2763036 RepID=A0ABR7D7E1_9CLOT|nr:hypothetical protein [Clostridium hominis]MBC5627270.1 hypothetical protein [Clostridium hominis]